MKTKITNKWFVTVIGYDDFYTPSYTYLSKTISLPVGKTPIDWFKRKPKCYSRFSFVPCALLSFYAED